MSRRCALGAVLCLAVVATVARAGGPEGTSPYVPVLSSYVQIRFTDPSKGDDTWAIRRFKAMIDGGSQQGIRYHFQFIYKTNLQSSTDDQIFLQDAYLVLPATKSLAFKIGQFVPPFGLERFQRDWKLDFVDRTDVTNRMVVNGNLGKSFARDRGVEGDWERGGWQVSTDLFKAKEPTWMRRGTAP